MTDYSDQLIPLSGIAYGVNIRGTLPAEFQQHLSLTETHENYQYSNLELSFQQIESLPITEEFWVGENQDAAIKSRFSLFKQTDGFGLMIDCQGQGLFRITSTRIDIEWLANGTGAAHYFFSTALALWLEYNNTPVLHASAVTRDNHTVALVGESGMGKSTLCAGLINLGWHFVTDDALPLQENNQGDWLCPQGPPWFRLWPNTLERYLKISSNDLPRVHDNFDKRMLALARIDYDNGSIYRLDAIYVLNRQAESTDKTVLKTLTSSESLINLIQYSLASSPAAAIGIRPQQIKQLARIAATIPVKRLSYPSGHTHWQTISHTIVDDFRC